MNVSSCEESLATDTVDRTHFLTESASTAEDAEEVAEYEVAEQEYAWERVN